MKKYIFAALAAALMMGATSCSDDFLEVMPEGDVTPPLIFENTENAHLAINGICRLMVSQYSGTQGFSGEGFIKLYDGNYQGNDFCQSNRTGWTTTANMGRMDDNTHSYCQFPWHYYYMVISNANSIILKVDGCKGLEAEKKFIKAQAYTFRAYAYTMLSQLYCKRWADSGNGASRGLPLRLNEGTEAIPACTLGELYTQIYADLDEAIALFKEALTQGIDRPKDDFWSPNLNVAYAAYTRAAITRQDWAKVVETAPKARDGYALMSGEKYCEGFNDNFSENIWGSTWSKDQSIEYYAFHAYMSPNGNSSTSKSNPPAIGRGLLERIPDSDVRKSLYLQMTPEEWDEAILSIKDTKAPVGMITKNGLANSKDKSARLKKRAQQQFGKKISSSSSIYAYMSVKFQVVSNPGAAINNFIRSSEMLLSEAEALCMLGGHDTEVQGLLVELNRNTGRDPEYSCNKTGAALLDEVRLYRDFELWGEGNNWFDYKRWSLPIHRTAYAEGGSCHPDMAVTIQPQESHHWTYVYPEDETKYNPLVTADE